MKIDKYPGVNCGNCPAFIKQKGGGSSVKVGTCIAEVPALVGGVVLQPRPGLPGLGQQQQVEVQFPNNSFQRQVEEENLCMRHPEIAHLMAPRHAPLPSWKGGEADPLQRPDFAGLANKPY